MTGPKVLTALFAAGLLSGCGALLGPVEGSGRIATRAVPVGDAFAGIEIEGTFRVEVTEAPVVAVSAEADDNLLPLLESEVINGRLRFRTARSFNSPNPFVLRIAAPALSSVAVAGAVTLTTATLAGDTVSVSAAGASQVAIGAIAGKAIHVVAGDTARVTMSGSVTAEILSIRATFSAAVTAPLDCADLVVNAEGAAEVRGPRTRTATLHLSAGASVDVDASERLTVQAIGSASVRYGGTPEVIGRAGAGVTIQTREE